MQENLDQEKKVLESDSAQVENLRARIDTRKSAYSPSGLETIVGCGYHSEAAAQPYDYGTTAFRHQSRREPVIGEANPAMINRALSDGLKI